MAIIIVLYNTGVEMGGGRGQGGLSPLTSQSRGGRVPPLTAYIVKTIGAQQGTNQKIATLCLATELAAAFPI